MIKSDNSSYCKVGRGINKLEQIEKISILLSQYWKEKRFDIKKNILYYGGTNNIFA